MHAKVNYSQWHAHTPPPTAVTGANIQSVLQMTRVFFIQHQDVFSCGFPVAMCVMMEVTQDPFYSLETCPGRCAQDRANRMDL